MLHIEKWRSGTKLPKHTVPKTVIAKKLSVLFTFNPLPQSGGGLTADFDLGRHLWCQGRRHEVLLGGGGEDGFIGTQTNLPSKFSFSSDLGHFIFKMMENANLY